MLCRSKINFACSEQEIKSSLAPYIPEQLLYASLGGTKPDDSYSFQRLDSLMRSLDKVWLRSPAFSPSRAHACCTALCKVLMTATVSST